MNAARVGGPYGYLPETAPLWMRQQEAAGGQSGGTVRVAAAPDQQAAAAANGWGGEAQFYGFNDFDALEANLREQQLAAVGTYFAPSGAWSSSVHAQAATQATAEAQRTRFGLEMQEMGRRTTWEAEQAMQDWRERESQAQRAQQLKTLYAQLRQQREMEMAASQRYYGAMANQDRWNMYGMMAELESVPLEDFGYGGENQLGGGW